MAHTYYNNCVTWSDPLEWLEEIIDRSREITLTTFRKYVDHDTFTELIEGMGYENTKRRGLTIANDYHVRFYSSWLGKKKVYYMVHSAIEYVFM